MLLQDYLEAYGKIIDININGLFLFKSFKINSNNKGLIFNFNQFYRISC